MTSRRLSRVGANIGIDFHVSQVLLFRGWSIIAGGLTVIVLPLWLSATQQGYYYTFSSVLALQVFFELGFNQIIVQLVGHEYAHVSIQPDGTLCGDPSRLGRLASLCRLISRWYAAASCFFLVVAGPAGAWFFTHKGTLPVSIWLGVWGVLVLATAGNLFFSPGLAVMEGTGKIGQVARLRLVQSVIGYLCLWVVLYFKGGLWAAVVTPLVAVLCTGWWLRSRGQLLARLSAMPVVASSRIRWGSDVFPFQWRIAASWISGYFIFNFFTPVVFSYQGAIEAGRLGLGLTVFNAVSTVGMSWVNAKVPQFAMMVSRGERKPLNALFKSVAIRSCIATVFMSALVVIGGWVLLHTGVRLATRVASPAVLGCLAWATSVNSAIFAMAAYMRAHREEPMLAASVTTGLLTGLTTYFAARYGVLPMMVLYSSVATFVALPWTCLLFARYYGRAV